MAGTREVSSEEVEAYEEMVLAHARRFARLPDLHGHEDDLAQEGRIAVWEALRDGHRPSNFVVSNAMRDYARTEQRKGLTGHEVLTEDLAPV